MDMRSELLKPLSLTGGHVLPSRIMAGPMEGIMNPLFCRTLAEMDLLDFWITPFIRVSTHISKLQTLKKKMGYFSDTGLPMIVQLLGNEPLLLAQVTEQLQELGIMGINLNYACPSKTVVSKGCGGGILKDIGLMKEVVWAIRERCPDLSISLKLRTGYSSYNEMEQILPEVSLPEVDFLMLHFRTTQELYTEVEDPYKRLACAVELTNGIPLIGSGDIFSVDAAKQMYEQSHCAGITVARGLFKSPFLIRHIQNYLAGIDSKSEESEKEEFYRKMLTLAAEDPEQYWRKGFFIEIAVAMWGKEHPYFKKIFSLDHPDPNAI
jgi:tRNA-dihydrouridine synthase C